MKCNKICKYLLFTHVVDPTEFVKERKCTYLLFYNMIFQRLTSDKQLHSYQLYMQNILYTAHIITHGITKSTVFINVFTIIL